jgi:tetratricopeptide (TPR) repeat protein
MKTFGAIVLFTLILFVISGAPISAQSPQAMLKDAQVATRKNDGKRAIEIYEKLHAQGYSSAAMYHNLGSLYFKAGQKGAAVLAYERALALAPADAQTLENLALVRESLEDQIDQSLTPNLGTRLLNPQWTLGRNSLAFGAAFLLWLGLGCLFLPRVWSKIPAQKWMPGVAWAALGLSLVLFAAASLAFYQTEKRPAAVVMSAETPLHLAPEKISKEVRKVHEGLKLSILDQIGNWYRVRLSNGDEGWVMSKDLTKI